ncbi:hypothetical protein F5Y01DRAFT_310995 [Xylaria sp. FL0043]|nr:hypothetical protein F5Y01DRAFT_310995 [Xylaria sp. FL0043]
MCGITVLRRHNGELRHNAADFHDSDARFCLFGEYCRLIKHSYLVYQDGEREVCAECDLKGDLRIARWSAEISLPTLKETPEWENLSTLMLDPSTIDVYNKTVQLELTRILSVPMELGRYNSILHYTLGLPCFIDVPPLIKIFGDKVGPRCGYQCVLELMRIAEGHGWEVELDSALGVAFKRHMDMKSSKKVKKKSKHHAKASKRQLVNKVAL